MRNRTWVITMGAALLLALATSVVALAAGGSPYSTTLSGAEETATADPDGSGTATFMLKAGKGEVCYEITVSNIATAIAAHIHVGPAGVNGPVVVPLAPPSEGTVNACTTGVDPQLIKSIIQNPQDYYVNVHNSDFPAGAIRGQLGK